MMTRTIYNRAQSRALIEQWIKEKPKMDLNEATNKAKHCLPITGYRYKQSGRNFVVESTGGTDVWDDCVSLAKAFETTSIDICDPDPSGVYIKDQGCGSCGHGSVIVLRGMIS